MKNQHLLLIICAAVTLFFLPVCALANGSNKTGTGPAPSGIRTMSELKDITDTPDTTNQVVVIYKNAGTLNVMDLSLTTDEVSAGKSVSDRVDVLEVSADVDIDDFIEKLNENPHVLAADRNDTVKTFEMPNDPYVRDGQAWQFQNIGNDKTWDQVSNTNTIGVAVLDTGLDTNHPDLVGRILPGYDYVSQNADITDQDGHGTQVSGFIVATANNNIGIAGVAGTANVKVAPYRVGGKSLLVSNICAALFDVANRPDIQIVNMSYGDYTYNLSEAAAIAHARSSGKILLASAGNEGDPRDPRAGSPAYPASYDGVISVAAIDNSYNRSTFSQYNSMIDLVAPGEKVVTTTLNGEYIVKEGTSFSTPIVSGACSVLLAANETLSPDDVEMILKVTARDLGDPGRDDYYGDGLIQLDQALQKASLIRRLTSIELSQSTMTLEKGNQRALRVNYSPQDTTDDTTVTWTSSNPSVASVDSFGNVTAINHGSCTITARIGDLLSQCSVNVPSYDDDISASYQTHIQNYGWQDWQYNGEMSGTSGQDLRLEGIKVKLDAPTDILQVAYQTHIQDIGWQDWRHDGDLSGTSGESLRLEAIRLELLGSAASQYDVYYRTHVQNLGWLDWTLNGTDSGSAGFGYRLEGIQIMVVKKENTSIQTGNNHFVQNQ